MIPIDGDFILAITPRYSGKKADTQKNIIGALSGSLASTLASYSIDSRLRIAHFMAQVCHECAGFCTTEEFASGAAYEGRLDLGNTEKGDGKRYKGRGLIQLTGRANYRRIGQSLQLPLEDEPELAGEPINALKIACEYWKSRNINSAADRDDLLTATRRVNGGLNGLDDRRAYLQKAKTALAAIEGLRVSVQQGGAATVLRRGSFGAAVQELQELLLEAGFTVAIDGDFGPATELAVVLFQRQRNLLADGIVGQQTWAALES